MHSQKEDEKERFRKKLFMFLESRGFPHPKVPQIGGKELDLLQLYNSVIKRGGAEKVSNLKQWKEIVSEFELPPSCTSASFTLKNHYQRYLLIYEQIHHFGKSENELVRVLENSRQRRPHNDPNRHIRHEVPRDRPMQSDTDLKKNLTSYYGDAQKGEEHISFIKRASMMPHAGEMKRITLAFDSKLQDEIRFALNCLLMYSCSTNSELYIEHYPKVMEGMITYLEGLIGQVPEFFSRPVTKLDSLSLNEKFQKPLGIGERLAGDYFMSDLGDIITANPRGPIEDIKRAHREMITMRYEEISRSEALEQIRILFQIIRNLICIPHNEQGIYDNKRFSQLIIESFFTCVDSEASKILLDIIAIFCKYLVISSSNSKAFCSRIVEYMNSDSPEELETALECFHNLMLSQENESIIESMLPEILDSIVRLLLMSTTTDPIESSLDLLCYLSDLRMSTKLLLAKKRNLIPRLLALIAGNTSETTEKMAKLSATILWNLCKSPAAKQFFVPYEKDIFCLATIDETVSKLLSEILLEVEPVVNNLYSTSTDFYKKKKERLRELHPLSLETKMTAR